MPNKRCTRCKKWKASTKITPKTHAWCYSLLHSEGLSFSVDENCYLCNKCWMHSINQKQHREIKVKKENTNDVEDMDTGIDEEEDSLTIENIIFADSGHKKCIVCRSDVHDGLIVMPKPARLDLLVLKRMYAPHGVRSCTEHLWNSRLLPDTEVNIDNRQTPISKLEPSVLLQLINDLLGLLQEASSTTRLDFMDPCLTDEDYLAWTGWNKQQFEDMFTLISPDIRTSFNRDAKNTLAMFWIKLKTNLSFRQIGSLFNIPGDGEHRRDPITSWYCQCKSGARTIGACAHEATIIWYLSYARHHGFEGLNGRRRIQQSIEKIMQTNSDEEEADDSNTG
ncbi:unnamed protein product [Rotaria sordida]|uniref:SWIM-type domain-containing protein n=1 Tax=Rotaria sordida TaxID=392033 RepID=A0A819MLC4_9BILA|nr:unnamed protein product [Rotaria sordida]